MLSRVPRRTIKRAGAPWMLGVLAVLQGTVVPAQGIFVDERVPFFVARPTTALFFSAELDKSSEETPGSQREQERFERRLQFDVSTSGFVYHPALVVYRLRVRPEFRWQDQGSGENAPTSRSQFVNYSVNTTWLKDKPVTVTLGAAQSRSEVSSRLADLSSIESSGLFGLLSLKSATLPTSISYNKSDSDSGGYLPSHNSSESWRLYSRHRSGASDTEFELDHQLRERTLRSSLSSVTRLNVDLTNKYTPNHTLDFLTRAGYSEREGGGRAASRYRLSGRLKVRHRRNLSSNYSAALNRKENPGYSSRSASYSAGLSHLLYENLATSLNVRGTSSESDVGKVLNYGGAIGLSYVRRIPWGQIRLQHSQGRGVRDDQRETTFVRVDDAVYAFDGVSASIILEDVNIDADSIVVTDAAGLVVYVPGIDYDTDTIGITTTVTRNALGEIGDDESVLVSYHFVANPPAKTETNNRSSGLQLSLWNHVDLFYNQSWQDEQFVAGILPEFPLDSRSKSAGINISVGPSITRFQVTELESARAPRKTKRISETLSFTLGSRVSLGLGLDYVESKLTDTGEVAEDYGASAALTWGLGRFGRLKIAAFARRSESSVREQNRRALTADYQWRFGAWQSRLYVAFDDTENAFVDTVWGRQRIYFETRRVFR
jgi:hypothetical protein